MSDNYELNMEQAIKEANRCLQCKVPQCRKGCPISNNIPEFIHELANGNLGDAYRIIARKSNLPAICGRVCAHELQCEGHCVLAKKDEAIRIGMLEKTIADFASEMKLPLTKLPQKGKGKIAVIGSGPAGLTVAGDLAKLGFSPTVFEALDEPGGILLYGIPSFRLSKKVVKREIDAIKSLGVTFVNNCVVGEDITVDDMFSQGFDAIFIGTGTAIARSLELPGKELAGIVQASYLLRMNYLFRSHQIGRDEIGLEPGCDVLVIGAGNVGMDAARSAKILGANRVSIVYHKTQSEMKALKSEYDATIDEGVEFKFEHKPLEFVGDGEKVTALIVDTPDGIKEMKADKILLAVGSRPASRVVSSTHGIDVDSSGYVVVSQRPYGMTSRKGVFAGGDVVHRPATVVLAMREAKRVAQGIEEYVNAVNLIRFIDQQER